MAILDQCFEISVFGLKPGNFPVEMNGVQNDGISAPIWTRTSVVTISSRRTVIYSLSITSGMALSTINDSESVPGYKLPPSCIACVYLISLFNAIGHQWELHHQDVPGVTQIPKHQNTQAFISAFATMLTPVWLTCVIEGCRVKLETALHQL